MGTLDDLRRKRLHRAAGASTGNVIGHIKDRIASDMKKISERKGMSKGMKWFWFIVLSLVISSFFARIDRMEQRIDHLEGRP